jgi:hypothetical protein
MVGDAEVLTKEKVANAVVGPDAVGPSAAEHIERSKFRKKI